MTHRDRLVFGANSNGMPSRRTDHSRRSRMGVLCARSRRWGLSVFGYGSRGRPSRILNTGRHIVTEHPTAPSDRRRARGEDLYASLSVGYSAERRHEHCGPRTLRSRDHANSFAVACERGTSKFSGIATSRKPKLYVVSVDEKPIYVGLTKQPIRTVSVWDGTRRERPATTATLGGTTTRMYSWTCGLTTTLRQRTNALTSRPSRRRWCS